MEKAKLGLAIAKLRKEKGVSTYALQKKGIHPTLPKRIEQNTGGYGIDTLLKYLNAIEPGTSLKIERAPGKGKKGNSAKS